MTQLEKLNKLQVEIASKEKLKSELESQMKALEDKLISIYGADWETNYQSELKKLEAWDDTCSA